LLARGDEVVCIDNLVTGRRANIDHLADHGRFEFREHDVVKEFDVDGPVDVVMNLASPASPKDYLGLPLETLEVGSTGTRNLLDLAHRHDAVFFVASTSEVYGDPLVHPQPETYWGHVNPIGERSVYDEAKRFSEALTMAYRRVHDLDVRIVRIFNTYGPRMQVDDGRVVSNFIVQALRGEPLTIYGDGRQTRSFCYVDDEIAGFLALLDSAQTDPINIGNPDEFTMLELAELVLELTDSTAGMTYAALPSDDPRQRRPDISKAADLLGWRPQVDLRSGLATTIPYFADALS
jgi:dTDP-glucose 4,6-dehydratase